MIHVERGGAHGPVSHFRKDGTPREWAELTDDEQDSVAYRAALDFLDDPEVLHDPEVQECTAAALRESGNPFWGRVAAAMDAETAARAARGTLRVARVADE